MAGGYTEQLPKDCPDCGAALPDPEADGSMRCESCGNLIRGPQPQQPATPPGSITINLGGFETMAENVRTMVPEELVFSSTTTNTIRTAKTGCGIGLIITLVTVGAVVAAIIGVVVSVKDGIDDATKAFGPTGEQTVNAQGQSLFPSAQDVLVLPGETSRAATYVGLFYNNKTDDHVVAKAEIGTGKVLWQAQEALGSNTYSAQFAQDGSRVYAAAGPTVRAYDARTGEQEYLIKTTDDIDTCDACLAVVGGHLMTRTKDGVLNSNDPVDGKGQWSRRWNDVNGQAILSNGRIVFTDDRQADGVGGGYLSVVDLANGRDIGTGVTPSCPSASFPGDVTEYQATYPTFPIPGSDDLVIFYSDGCVQRVNPTAGQVVWTRSPKEYTNYDQSSITVTSKYVLASGYGGLDVFSLATGGVRHLDPPQDSTVVGRWAVGSRVIGVTQSQRGTTKYGLQAWNVGTGALSWTLNEGTAQPMYEHATSSETLTDGESRFLVLPTDTSVRVLTFAREKQALTIQDLDPATGRVRSTVSGTYGGGSETGSHSLTVLRASGDQLLLSVDNDFQAIDLKTAKVTAISG